ncbi:hypothetical protein [Photobacterium angustum]|uniref:hypothetical protein n=1 Tax=Photobacterium angustum TaxID=661 RepID=UPI001C6281E2|nr:hypothetical protein [Photobacterium angustum]
MTKCTPTPSSAYKTLPIPSSNIFISASGLYGQCLFSEYDDELAGFPCSYL